MISGMIKPKLFGKKKFTEETVIDAAYRRTRRAFDMFDHIAVSFSGGKDSTCCLHIALDVARERDRLPLRVLTFDEEAIPYETEEYCRRVAAWDGVDFEWYALPVKHRNACSRKSPWWWCWDPDHKDLWVRPMPPEGITEIEGFSNHPAKARLSIPATNGLLFHPKKYGRVGMIMGIRAQESITRQRAVSHDKAENYIISYNSNVWKVYPIYDWMTNDVWTAPNLFGWDYNSAYDVMDKAGLAPLQQRCCPPYGEEPLQKFWTYRVCWPDLWDRMVSRVPGANAAVRYCTTELWAFGSVPDKPENMPWDVFLRRYIEKFNPGDQRRIAERIQAEIRNHFSKTSDPILPDCPHPMTGLDMRFLTVLAIRGDFKNRKQASTRADKIPTPQAWHKYSIARSRWMEGIHGSKRGEPAGEQYSLGA